MRPPKHLAFKSRPVDAGFSLIEVVLAIGIIGFAVIPMMGLLAMGFSGYRSANDLNVGAVIVQNIRSISAGITNAGQSVNDVYFDVDGTPTPSNSGTAIYKVTSAPATNASVAGSDSPTLISRFAIIYIPSGQTRYAGVVHITPR